MLNMRTIGNDWFIAIAPISEFSLPRVKLYITYILLPWPFIVDVLVQYIQCHFHFH